MRTSDVMTERYQHNGWTISYSDSRPVTGKWRAERYGVGMCAASRAALIRMIDTRNREAREARQ